MKDAAVDAIVESFLAKGVDAYDTDDLIKHFEVLGFQAPFVVVKRKSDGKRGSLQFQHSPRVYFQFLEDNR